MTAASDRAMGVNVATMLRSAARQHGDRVAVRYGERRVSYAELDELAARFGSALVARGLRRGDRVALFMRNCPEYVVALYGAFTAGLVVVPVNAKLAAAELEVILADSGARALVVGDDLADAASAAASSGLDVLARIGGRDDGDGSFAALLADGDPDSEPVELAADEPAWLFYTSGTTGRPKGACLTHRNLTAMVWLLLADVCAFRDDDVVLHVAPLSHGSGMYLLGAIARGAQNLIYERPSYDPADVLRRVERERVTVIAFLAPTMIVMLLDVAGEQVDTSSLRCVIYGGAPIHLDHARRMVRRFGPVFVQIYGQGEAPMTITSLRVTAAVGADPAALASAGVPHPGVEVRIVDEREQPVEPGAEGEVCVRGDVVMGGYWNAPEATAAALRGGWLHTGDIGRFDAAGRLVLLDRRHDTIISGGTNIYPREVEETLLEHECVAEAIAFGVPDELWGESVAAAVVVTGERVPTQEELVDFCRRRMASFKKPKQIVYLDELPKNAYGKVLRRQLREQLTR